ncbi:MAG TPA: hypothetical protein VFQ53_02190 [Kofleriaceae bacterium]|nr:hypothetical protein [Kofleriaceae bacterium]
MRIAPCLGLAVLAWAGLAEAGPVATLRDDIDGDGTQDTIELTADGIVHVGKAQQKVASAVTEGKLAVAHVAGNAQLVVDVTSGGKREAVVLDRGKGWREVARFPLGGIGLDREYSMDVDASPAGVVRYQTRWDVRRCDDKPAYLFAERLDGGTFRRLDRPPTHVPANAPALSAKLDPTPATPPLVYQARSASHEPGATDAGALSIPRELDDGRLDTAWREDLPTAGEGQFFTFRPRIDTARAQQLRIVPGNAASQATLRASNRPRTIAIIGKQSAWRVELPDAANDALGAAYVVELPPQVTECVTVVLESTYGKPNGATAISELAIYAEGERSGGGDALLARVLAEGHGDIKNVTATLGKRGAAGAAAIDAELAKTTDAGARRRLIAALAKIQDPAATASLVRAASEGWVRDRDLLDVIAALGANRQVTPLRDLAGKGGLAIEMRVAAASKILPIGPGFAALVELAGRTPREVRHQVIEQLALAPPDLLVQTAAATTEPAVAGDLWRAVTRKVRSDPKLHAAAVTAMLAALPTATDYERRYRLIDGIATLGDPAALGELEKLLRSLPAGAQASALRQVAIHGIASTPRTEAAPIVVGFARDPDPGVRLAALSALANATSDTAGVWHAAGGVDAIDRVLINGLADTWPEIRRRAAAALGNRCERPGPATALIDTISKDRSLEVRIDALTALVQCRGPGIREILPAIWNSPKAPLELRKHSIGQVRALADKGLANTLVERFKHWRGQAIESAEAMQLAIAATVVIGELQAQGAAAALIEALDDSAFPEIVSAAALGLGALGPACPSAAKAKLTQLARSGEQSANAARHAAAQCGR